MNTRQLVGLAGVFLLLSLAGCASIPLAPQTMDQAAKEFDPRQGKAGIYIVRMYPSGGHQLFQVVWDGEMIGSIAYHTYHRILADPGKHDLTVISPEKQVSQRVEVRAGELRFFEVMPQIGVFAPRVRIKELNATAGREAVRKSELAKRIGQAQPPPGSAQAAGHPEE